LQQVSQPFGSQFGADSVERTSVAQDREGALLAADLLAQKNAVRPVTGA
jgi:hypothetical protein